MQVNNNIINTVGYNQQTPQQQISDNAENIKQQRQQIFFSSINLSNKENNFAIESYGNISDEIFYHKIITASFVEIKKKLISHVEELIKLDNFYCNAMHRKDLITFITLVKNQNETNNKSIKNDLPGKIHLIKKDLFKEFTNRYINEKKADNPDFFIIGNKIHLFNRLNNLVADTYGSNKISDKYEEKQIDSKIMEEFIELSQIEVSPSKITAVLLEEIYTHRS